MVATDVINSSQIVIDNHYVRAFYNPEKQLVGIEWKGPCTKEEYKELFDKLLDNARKNPTQLFYTDIRKQGVIAIESRKHFENYVTPESVKLGLRKTAVVTDSNVFKRYYLNLLIKASNKFGNPVKLRLTPEEALDFLFNE